MTSSGNTTHLSKVLQALASRVHAARASGKDAPLGVAVGVIGDLARFMTTASPADVRMIQAKVAGVREKLRYDDAIAYRPKAILDHDKNNQMFLAGALWAAGEFLEARLQDAQTLTLESKASQRGALRELIKQLVRTAGTATPKDCIDEARRRGLEVRPDQVSRALGDLLRDGTVMPTEAPADGDRRNRYFTLAPAPSPRRPAVAANHEDPHDTNQ